MRQHLVQHYGIDASRLKSQGLGQSRRVELVRLKHALRTPRERTTIYRSPRGGAGG